MLIVPRVATGPSGSMVTVVALVVLKVSRVVLPAVICGFFTVKVTAGAAEGGVPAAETLKAPFSAAPTAAAASTVTTASACTGESTWQAAVIPAPNEQLAPEMRFSPFSSTTADAPCLAWLGTTVVRLGGGVGTWAAHWAMVKGLT